MSIASLYPSINPSLLLDFANVKRLDPRITFTRTTTATYYDGVTTAVAEQNLFLYSQQMDNASGWATNGITVTADNANAPDGTTTAELLTATSGTSGKLIQNGTLSPASSTTYTFSFFIKAGTHNFIQFMNANDAQAYANFNASTGALGNYGSNTTATITSVGNSWYRCVLTFSSAATLNSSFRWYMVASNTAAWASSLAAAGTETMYIWGAQAEQRSSATAYTATTTQAITNYIPVLQTASAGQARFDHNPTTGESLGLLIEEARTNLATYSADFSNAAWTKNSLSITSNTIVAPDGTLTGDKFIANSSATYHYGSQNTGSVSAPWTFSCYAKAGEYSRVGFAYTNTGYVFFNLLTGVQEGTVGGGITSTSITAVGNGWYRISFTSTSTASGVNVGIYLFNGSYSSGEPTFSGDGFSGAFIWGAQLEAGSFATSYIPTVASSVTRNADAASMTGTNFSSWFGGGNISIYAEAAFKGYVSNQGAIVSQVSDGSTNNNIDVYWYNGAPTYYVTSAGSNVINLGASAISANTFMKFSAANAFNDSAVSFNGAAIQTDTSCALPTGLNKLNIGNTQNYGAQYMSGWIKKLAYYPQRLTNTNLVALAS